MQKVKSLENYLAMKGGDGDTSYARVSLFGQVVTLILIISFQFFIINNFKLDSIIFKYHPPEN